jgi:hypothetical protein
MNLVNLARHFIGALTVEAREKSGAVEFTFPTTYTDGMEMATTLRIDSERIRVILARWADTLSDEAFPLNVDGLEAALKAFKHNRNECEDDLFLVRLMNSTTNC